MSRTKSGAVLAAVMLALSLFLGLTSQEVSAKKSDTTSYILPGQNVFPEGVATQKGTPYFYVSSTTNGAIFRGNVNEPQTEVFLPGGQDGRTTAIGLKVDKKGRLFIAGGDTGKVFVYDTKTKGLLFSADNNLAATFINDVAVTKDGAAYFTDSVSPNLYRVTRNAQGGYEFGTFLNFTGTVLTYQPGFNLNGIAASPDGKYLIVVQSNTGKLFRIEIATKTVSEISLGGATVTDGDGILLKGRTLYVVRNAEALIVEIKLAGDLSSGKVVSQTTDPSFIFPTTIASSKGRLLVVNSQFNNRGGTPVNPFTVSSIKRP